MIGIGSVECIAVLAIAILIVDPSDWPVIIRTLRRMWHGAMRVYHEIMGQCQAIESQLDETETP
ncbi:MAG: hypothetical protein P8L47_03920 [Candidatus Marinamargulisbacteria bacterium]|nr:hypothetical protein [bacterium]MDG2265251.1 hypothetical protein [Candidatus Marinamargulisbacteria bacterium]|tara:strand:+ start:2419 stop:2610 length:192 start_codon:yes stop_codon:yes gene_type:complete